MGVFSNIVSAIKNSNIGPGIFSGSSVPSTTKTTSATNTNKNNVSSSSSKGSVGANANKANTGVSWHNPKNPNSTPWSLASTLNNLNKPISAGSSGVGPVRKGSDKAVTNKPSTGVYWPNPTDPNSSPWSLTSALKNINKQGVPVSAGTAGVGPIRKESDPAVTNKPNTGVSSSNPNYQASKEAVDAYMSGTYFGPTWEKAKERNPLLTDEALIENYKDKAQGILDLEYPGNPAPGIYSDPELIKTLEQQANKAYALKRKQSPDYIAKDYNEYVDMVNQGLIAPTVKLDATGKQVSIPYSASKEDYNAYLQRKYADNGDDYYNRSYGELAKDDPKFWAGDPEAFDADGNPVDTNTYLWLLNNPLTRTVLQGMDASGNFSGAGPTMEQLVRDPSTGGYGLYSEGDIADMYASHILAGDEMGAMLESNPELLNAILTQAYTPTVDSNNPVIYEGYKNGITGDKNVSGTLNLVKDHKTPTQLAAELLADPTSAEGMNNLQILAAANVLNNQDVPASEKTGNKNKPSSSSGSGGSGGGSYGGGNMPAGGNPETVDTLYSMPEVGNYAARMILNKMLPTGYDYDYNKRLDKRLADIAAAEQNYKGNVLPSVERTYQDQAANTMANLVAALRANRASGLTSGASRGAQAASDVQAVQAASKENSENLRKLVNDNLASFLTQLANKRATAGNDTASELQGYASPMMTALGEVLAQYNYGSAAAQVNNGGLRRMQSYLV